MGMPTTLQIVAATLFAAAILHTFCTRWFERLAHVQPRHAGLWHLLGEVEVVFGVWALLLILAIGALEGQKTALDYLDSRNYTEPLFVFAVMVIAATRGVLQLAGRSARLLARGLAALLSLPRGTALYFVVLSLVPLLGSFITEPAAMTLAALLLRDSLFSQPSTRALRYGTLGVLFVNVSIGGTLTSFAAPPVLMVAGPWSWDMAYMLTHFGWRAALAVVFNAAVITWWFRQQLKPMGTTSASTQAERVPAGHLVVHLLFLAGVVIYAHHPAAFLGLFLFFMGYSAAYRRHHDRLILREALLVAFFLGGLVVLGGLQEWWLQPVLMRMSANTVFFGATALTALTDNAALTYLGSLVPGLAEDFKQALVAGAVTGGGLTVIANAPNPAGIAILRGKFEDQTVSPMGLLAGALPPTLVAIAAFRLL